MKSSLHRKGDVIERLRALTRELRESPQIKVGVLGSQGAASHQDQLTNADLMAIHEYGAPRAGIPARAPLRTTADTKRDAWFGLLERVIRSALAKRVPLSRGLELAGLQAVRDVVAMIRKRLQPPLSPKTIAAKGSSVPLVDTGRLVQSISHQVVRGRR